MRGGYVKFFGPNGAAECSHGWSDAAFGVAQPVETFVSKYIRPEGAAGGYLGTQYRFSIATVP